MATRHSDLSQLSDVELSQLARAAMTVLARRGQPAAFAELLTLSEHLGVSLGDAARNVAAQGSWSQVADVSGTSKQAAWSRWST